MSNKMIGSANLLLLLAAFFLLFWSLGDRALWSSEGRWAEITREMFTSGDFFHPTIGGEPYFDKPLLTYWVIAAVSAVTGRLDEFIIRLPSAICIRADQLAWESPRICEKKLKAWLVNSDVLQVAMKSEEANSAK